jgi:hypothetical protein
MALLDKEMKRKQQKKFTSETGSPIRNRGPYSSTSGYIQSVPESLNEDGSMNGGSTTSTGMPPQHPLSKVQTQAILEAQKNQIRLSAQAHAHSHSQA